MKGCSSPPGMTNLVAFLLGLRNQNSAQGLDIQASQFSDL